MTREEVKKYAMQHYDDGGDVIVECWTDADIDDFLRESKRHKTDLNALFGIWDDERCLREYEYTSSTNGDYSPSNPWDAPGMSISDFI